MSCHYDSHCDPCGPPRRSTCDPCMPPSCYSDPCHTPPPYSRRGLSTFPTYNTYRKYNPMSTPVRALNPAECQGYLTKQGGWIKNWKRRWFVLKDGKLFYYVSQSSSAPQGVIHLDKGALLVKSDTTAPFYMNPSLLFTIRISGRSYYIEADNNIEYNRWFDEIERSINGLTQNEVLEQKAALMGRSNTLNSRVSSVSPEYSGTRVTKHTVTYRVDTEPPIYYPPAPTMTPPHSAYPSMPSPYPSSTSTPSTAYPSNPYPSNPYPSNPPGPPMGTVYIPPSSNGGTPVTYVQYS